MLAPYFLLGPLSSHDSGLFVRVYYSEEKSVVLYIDFERTLPIHSMRTALLAVLKIAWAILRTSELIYKSLVFGS